MSAPKLYLLPCALGEPSPEHIPESTLRVLDKLDMFIVERARTARRFIKACLPPKDISQLIIIELDKHEPSVGIAQFVAKMGKENRSAGLLSEAGCPGVADPGALVVAEAHRAGVQVIPMVGPSAILLAIMASGMNGQSFAFHGYLPVKKPELAKVLKRLEEQAHRNNQTQLFIEAPYRNQSLIGAAMETLKPNTRLCMAMDLTMPTELIINKKIDQWKSIDTKPFHKRPAIFLIG